MTKSIPPTSETSLWIPSRTDVLQQGLHIAHTIWQEMVVVGFMDSYLVQWQNPYHHPLKPHSEFLYRTDVLQMGFAWPVCIRLHIHFCKKRWL
jgi:hypothetical protein